MKFKKKTPPLSLDLCSNSIAIFKNRYKRNPGMKVKTSTINRKKISWLLEQDLHVKIEAQQHHLDISHM